MGTDASPVASRLALDPLAAEHAGVYFGMVEASREALRTWLTRRMAQETVEEVQAYIAARVQGRAEGREAFFLLRDGQEAVGLGFLNSIHPQHRFANLGYWIRSDRTGRGYATAAVHELALYGFRELGLLRIEIVVEPANRASLRVAEKSGAVREGVLRDRLVGDRGVRDGVMFSLIPSDLVDSDEGG